MSKNPKGQISPILTDVAYSVEQIFRLLFLAINILELIWLFKEFEYDI